MREIVGGTEMKDVIYVALAVLIVTIVMLSGCTGVLGPEETEKFNREVPAKPGSDLAVVNRNGGVDMGIWEEDYVAVTAVKRTFYGRAELEKARIEVTENDPILIWTVHTGMNARVSVDYTVQIPADVVLRGIDTSNGQIRLQGVQVAGTEIHTSNGPVIVDGAPGGDLTAVTSNGWINLSGVEGYVTAKTSNDGIMVERSGGVGDLQASNGPISAEISAIRGDVTISTSNGEIALRIAKDLNARVIATTSNGRIAIRDLPLRVSESTETSVLGSLGAGGPTITIVTSNGDINLAGL